MALRLGKLLMQTVNELRYEPTPKRIRAMLGERAAVDTTRALLVWEPRRVVPCYAVPVEDLRGDVVTLSPSGDDGRLESARVAPVTLGRDGPATIDHASFRAHTAGGEELTVAGAGVQRAGGAFRPTDPDLAGYVLLDFDAFESWLEEEEEVRGHPRDPFHRVDVRQSSRHVRVELDGVLIAESSRPRMLFETKLPPRVYIPRADVRMERLRPSPKRTVCAYKGEASYFSVVVEGRTVDSAVWTYEAPLPDAVEIAGLLSFYDERVDVVVEIG